MDKLKTVKLCGKGYDNCEVCEHTIHCETYAHYLEFYPMIKNAVIDECIKEIDKIDVDGLCRVNLVVGALESLKDKNGK